MKIRVKAGGLLAKHLPEGTAGNTAEIEVADGATVADVMAALGMPVDARCMTITGDANVPAGERASHRLAEGDQLSIMPPLKGG